MIRRLLLFTALAVPCALIAKEDGPFKSSLNRIMSETTNKSSLTFEGKTFVDAEIVKIGSKYAIRLTYDDGAQQLLVQNIAGKFVPVHKARRQVMNALTSLATYLGVLALGGVGGAYLLYHNGTQTADGKRVVPTFATILQILINKLPGSSQDDH